MTYQEQTIFDNPIDCKSFDGRINIFLTFAPFIETISCIISIIQKHRVFFCNILLFHRYKYKELAYVAIITKDYKFILPGLRQIFEQRSLFIQIPIVLIK
jgi:hypothetical protein